MKRLYIFLLFILISSVVLAAGLEVQSFEIDNHDLHGSVFPIRDANGDNCALIRVEHNLSEAVHLVDVEVYKREEKAANVIYFYISKWEQSFTISVTSYMPVKYKFKESLKSETVYVLRLSGDEIDTNLLDIPVSISSSPSGATVYIDNIRLSEQTPVSDFFISGEYPLRIELEDYVTYEDKIIITGNKVERQYELEPDFGHLTVSSLPIDGLEIYLNGEYAGKTPLEINRCKAGEYHLTSVHDYYRSAERNFTISGGEKLNLKLEAEANFGSIEVVSEPATGFSVYVNNIYAGKTPLLLEKQRFGEYQIRIEHDLYSSATKTVSLTRNTKEKVILQADQNYGILNIKTDNGVDVYLNGQLLNKYQDLKLSPQTINLRAEKAKHETVQKREILSSGDVLNIDLYPEPLLGTILVNPQPKDAIVSITGDSGEYYQDKGICRFADIAVGNYLVKTTYPEFLPYEETVHLQEGDRIKLEPVLEKCSQGFSLDIPQELSGELNIALYEDRRKKRPIKVFGQSGNYSLAEPGKYYLVINRNSKEIYRERIKVISGEFTQMNLLYRKYITNYPECKLYVDNKFIDRGKELVAISGDSSSKVKIKLPGYTSFNTKFRYSGEYQKSDLTNSRRFLKKGYGIALNSDSWKVFYGFKLPLIYSPYYDTFNGIDINFYIAGNIEFDLDPAYDFNGLAISGLIMGADDFCGLGVGGLFSGGDEMNGILLSGIGNIWDEYRGITLSGIYSYSRLKASGIMASALWLYNEEDFSGFSFSTVNICGSRYKGLQVGLYNSTKYLQGIQIGLINVESGEMRDFPFFPFINVHF